MSQANCPLCKETKNKPVFSLKPAFLPDNALQVYLNEQTLSYFRCLTCSLIFVIPVPPEDLLFQYYAEQKLNPCPDKLAYLPIIKEIVAVKPAGNFLDVGFGSGEVAALAKDFGFQVYGVEWCGEAARAGSGFHQVFEGNFLTVSLPENFFDAVSLMTLLEHLPDPEAALKKCWQVLKPGGILALTVPHYGLSAKLLGPYWLYFSPSIGHLFVFSCETMRFIEKHFGFHVRTLKTASVDASLSALKTMPRRTRVLSFLLQSAGSFINLVLKRFSMGDVLLCILEKS